MSGCGYGRNYLEPAGPRYAGAPTGAQQLVLPDTLQFASFNIEFAMRIDSAIAVVLAEPRLRRADILLLQEMDEAGTRRIAEALDMGYVYYPATFHFRTRRNFGNAVLSRWPIVADRKILLPHRSRYSNTLRTATAATVLIGDRRVRAYSAHLGTYADVDNEARVEQLRAIMEDAAGYAYVVIAGDMNHPTVSRTATYAGYRWPTADIPATSFLGRLDHILLRGFMVPEKNGAGTITNVRGASDHLPVWAIGVFPY